MRAWRSALIAVLVTVLAFAAGGIVPAAAEDPPARPKAAAPDLDKSLATVRALVDEERWTEGAAAVRKLFADFPGDPRVRAKLREIEDQLKLCLFRASLPPIKGADFFGTACRRFSPSTRDIELSFGRLAPPLWDTEGAIRLLNVRLEGSQTLEAELDYLDAGNRTTVFVLCWDVEKRGGYSISPGYFRQTETSTLQAKASIVKVNPGADKTLAEELPLRGNFSKGLVIQRTGGDIVVRVGGATVVRASDSSYMTGYIGVKADGVSALTVKGRVDRHAWRKMVGERFAREFAAWEASAWDRAKEIPEWARGAAAARDATLDDLPADAPERDLESLRSQVAELADGNPLAAAAALLAVRRAPPHTRLYVEGLANVALGGYRRAAESLGRLAEEEPEFVPARLFRGVAYVGMRRLCDARADLEWARTKRPGSAHALVALARLSLLEGDVPGADTLLARAAEEGAAGPRIDEARDWVHRCRKGPALAQRFEHETERFIVVSDHSKKVCYDTATLLEAMQSRYADVLGQVKGRVPKARVYVFSGQQGYLGYADGLHVAADQTAGVYLPMLRELCMWIPLDMTSYTDTVRHEGFHQYLHRFVDDAPPWFNEGWASVLGGGGAEGLRDAKRDAEFVRGFVPVRELVAMRHSKFMAIAGVAYTESRYLVDFLRNPRSERLRPVLREYFAALQEGLSQDEANAKVVEPVMDVLEAEFARSR